MGLVSVAEAARRLGVGVPRIHQRIRDGSLPAERLGSQWVVDEMSLIHLVERGKPGRPLSARSAWAIIALAEGDDEACARLAAAERSRARARLEALLSLVRKASRSEDAVRQVASVLRLRFRNRAALLPRRAALADLEGLRRDPRWQALVRPAASGIASPDVVGYLTAEDVLDVEREHLLLPSRIEAEANVRLYILPEGQKAYPDSLLRLAADLSDVRGPREELRVIELLVEVAAALRVAGR
jgi:excisionase family DNA binding protein